MNRRLWEIVEELSEEEYRTSGYLGERLGISEKTVRTRINELNEEISGHGAQAVSRPRYGYCLEIDDREAWEVFCSTKSVNDSIPSDSDERIDYLLAMFLNRDAYQKLEDLSEFLYVSPKTLSNEMKKVEYILSRFSLGIERRPHYGMRITGTEFDKRRCILQHFFVRVKPFWEIQGDQEKLSMKIADWLKKLSAESKIRFSETAFQDTVLYFYESITRMNRGMYIEDIPGECGQEKAEEKLAERLFDILKDEIKGKVPCAEIRYAGIYISGKRFIGTESGSSGSNFVMSDKTDLLVMRILDSIYETYHVELRDNLNLRMMLNQHMIPMGIRLKYGIPIEDWQVNEIRDKYVFAYTMAQQAARVISEEYKKEVSENETACLAVYFELAMEEEKSREKKKKNILLVCVSGKASSRMLIYRFRKEFKDYIGSLQVCGMYDFDTYDLTGIDFIFSTVPIYKKVPIPVMEIHDFLEAGEIMAVRRFLEVGEFDFLDKFYSERYFFTGIDADTREEAIHEICERIQAETALPEGFEESVLQRESFGPTDFGNLTAIPHPCRIMTKETIVAVAVLSKEILWSTQKVRVIILTSLSEEESEDVHKFYDVTAAFLMDKEAVRELIDIPAFERFRQLLRCVDRRNKNKRG